METKKYDNTNAFRHVSGQILHLYGKKGTSQKVFCESNCWIISSFLSKFLKFRRKAAIYLSKSDFYPGHNWKSLITVYQPYPRRIIKLDFSVNAHQCSVLSLFQIKLILFSIIWKN